jgi:putative flippase GtrA
MNKLLKQILGFLGFSGIGWILDFITYTALAFLGTNLFLCNILGAVVGVTFVFTFSTRFLFEDTKTFPLWSKYIAYVIYEIILICLVSKLLVLVDTFVVSNLDFAYIKEFSIIFSKMFVTPITMVMNFIVMKILVEKV